MLPRDLLLVTIFLAITVVNTFNIVHVVLDVSVLCFQVRL